MSVNTDTTVIAPTNSCCKRGPAIRLLKAVPISIPIKAPQIVSEIATTGSTSWALGCSMNARKPENDMAEITTKDVAIALRMLMPVRNVNAGTIRKPPPTP